MLALSIKESFWDRGDFPEVVNNGSDYIVLKDPWVNGTLAAPFDKRAYYFLAVLGNRSQDDTGTAFYLILNVAVGGTSGWFPDGFGGKPWLDGSLSMCYVLSPLQHSHPSLVPSRHVGLCQETG